MKTKVIYSKCFQKQKGVKSKAIESQREYLWKPENGINSKLPNLEPEGCYKVYWNQKGIHTKDLSAVFVPFWLTKL